MQKTERIWLDGALVPWDEARVHVLTHTLHYGLGVFEGIRCYQTTDGRSAVFRLREHTRRLFGSAHILELAIPFTRGRHRRRLPRDGAVATACASATSVRSCSWATARWGCAATNPVRVAIAAWPWGSYLGDEGLRNGIRVKTSSFQRFHANTMMTKAKAVGHYVNSILAAQEARRAGYDEALLLDVDGFVSEASGENIFIVRDGRGEDAAAHLGARRHHARHRHHACSRERGSPSARGALHARRGLPRRRGVLHRHGGRGHARSASSTTGRSATASPGRSPARLQEAYFALIRGGDPRHADWLAYV